MRRGIVLAALLLGACGQVNTLNSVSTDPFRYSGEGTSEFMAARSIIVEKCSGCHYEYASKNESDWVASGEVVAGNAASSVLFASLAGSGVATGRQDMPLGGTLSAEEIQAIETWIDSIAP